MLKLALIAVILSILSGILYGAVQYGIGKERAEWQWKVIQAERSARDDERRKQGAINEVIKRQYNEIAIINTNLNNDIIELSNRPASSLPRDPEIDCSGANGSELAREHAQFSIEYGAKAATQDAALEACYRYADSLQN